MRIKKSERDKILSEIVSKIGPKSKRKSGTNAKTSRPSKVISSRTALKRLKITRSHTKHVSKRWHHAFLVDPVRALSEIGIELSPSIRRHFERVQRNSPTRDSGLYDAVRKGRVKIPFITNVRISSKRRK